MKSSCVSGAARPNGCDPPDDELAAEFRSLAPIVRYLLAFLGVPEDRCILLLVKFGKRDPENAFRFFEPPGDGPPDTETSCGVGIVLGVVKGNLSLIRSRLAAETVSAHARNGFQ